MSMQRELTIAIDEQVDARLHEVVGRGRIRRRGEPLRMCCDPAVGGEESE